MIASGLDAPRPSVLAWAVRPLLGGRDVRRDVQDRVRRHGWLGRREHALSGEPRRGRQVQCRRAPGQGTLGVDARTAGEDGESDDRLPLADHLRPQLIRLGEQRFVPAGEHGPRVPARVDPDTCSPLDVPVSFRLAAGCRPHDRPNRPPDPKGSATLSPQLQPATGALSIVPPGRRYRDGSPSGALVRVTGTLWAAEREVVRRSL